MKYLELNGKEKAMSELTREQKQKILNGAPAGAESYRMDSELYYKFDGDACLLFNQDKDWVASCWLTKGISGFIKLSDLRKELPQTKITSADINWTGNNRFAIVSEIGCGLHEQCELVPKVAIDDEGDLYYIANDLMFKATRNYVVEREYKKTVVDAVNFMWAKDQRWDLFYDRDCSEFTLIYQIDSTGYRVCTVDEYNQCVKEMSEAAWMNDGEPQSYEAYKAAYHDIQEDEYIEWKNGDECIYNDKNYIFECVASFGNKDRAILSSGERTKDVLIAFIDALYKPQTQEQKADREREEMAKALYDLEVSIIGKIPLWGAEPIKIRDHYRKMIEAGVQLPKENKQ